MTEKMNLQVQPLKVLATREVVMNKMDYSTFLGGTTKDELDKLDKLAGRYRIKSSKLAIEAIDNEKLWKVSTSAAVVPLDDWEYLKDVLLGKLPIGLINFIEGTEEFIIADTNALWSESTDKLRNWVMLNKHQTGKELLTTKGKLVKSSRAGGRIHCEGFIEDGKLMTNKKFFNSKMEMDLCITDSINTDREGNIIWKFMLSLPARNIKITKIMWAVKI